LGDDLGWFGGWPGKIAFAVELKAIDHWSKTVGGAFHLDIVIGDEIELVDTSLEGNVKGEDIILEREPSALLWNVGKSDWAIGKFVAVELDLVVWARNGEFWGEIFAG
jgi:hypothetical protein